MCPRRSGATKRTSHPGARSTCVTGIRMSLLTELLAACMSLWFQARRLQLECMST